MRELNQLQQFRGCGAFFLHPRVHGLFDGPGGFAEAHEPHHASAALQGVKAAADCCKRFLVRVLFAHRVEMFADRRQHLVGFLQIDPEELGVDRLGACVDKLGGFR